MELKVRAIREKDFKAPIALRLLYNPPGTSSSGSSQIPEGKDEAHDSNHGRRERRNERFQDHRSRRGHGRRRQRRSRIAVHEAHHRSTLLRRRLQGRRYGARQGTTYVAQLTNNVEFDGKAKVQLVGLPAEATSEPVEVTKDSTEATFIVKTTGKTPAGRHKAIYCNLVVTQKRRTDRTHVRPRRNSGRCSAAPKPTAQKTRCRSQADCGGRRGQAGRQTAEPPGNAPSAKGGSRQRAEVASDYRRVMV